MGSAISPDPVAKVKKFHEKYDLNFPLLADEDHAVAEAYGVWVEKSMYGRTYWGAQRATFLIDEQGVVRHRHDHLLGLDYQSVDDLIRRLDAEGFAPTLILFPSTTPCDAASSSERFGVITVAPR